MKNWKCAQRKIDLDAYREYRKQMALPPERRNEYRLRKLRKRLELGT